MVCGMDYFHYNYWDEFYDKLVFREINGKPIIKNGKFKFINQLDIMTINNLKPNTKIYQIH